MKKMLLFGMFVLILWVIGFFLVKKTFYPKLEEVSLVHSEVVGEIPSPDENYQLTLYLYGGVLFKWDYSYIGELEDLKTKEKKKILWLSSDTPNVKWMDEDTVQVRGRTIDIKRDIFDERKK